MSVRLVRSFVALMSVAVVAAFVLVVPLTPAQAALWNPIPMNQNEEPTFEFLDAEVLVAYVTSDVKGGRVCVVADTLTDPAQGDCDSPAWGEPNTVVGVGSSFTMIEAPPLRPGTWRLLTEDVKGMPLALSETFVVRACLECPASMAPQYVAEWKARAASMRNGLNLTCQVFALKEDYQELKKIYDGYSAVRGSIDGFKEMRSGGFDHPTSILFGLTPLWEFSWSEMTSDYLKTPMKWGQDEALKVLNELSCTAGQMYDDIVNDPPDPAYATVAPPVFIPLPPSDSPSLTH